MRTTWLCLLAIGCGNGASGGGGDAGPGDGGGGGDGPSAAFCDGTPHLVGNGLLRQIGVDAQGRLLVLGTQVEPRQTLYVRRYLASGELDAAFGSAGVVTTAEATDAEVFAQLGSGGIVVGGGLVEGDVQAPLVLGLDAAGQPTGFRVTEPAGSDDRYVQALLPQGSAFAVEIDYALRRLGSDGTFDATFAGSGALEIGFAKVVETTDGAFVVAQPSIGPIGIDRYTRDGAPVSGSMIGSGAFQLQALLTLGSDATVVAASPPPDEQILVGRELANGQPDTADYGSGGFVALAASAAGSAAQAEAAAELPDGELLIGGTVGNGSAAMNVMILVGSDGAVARVTPIALETVASVTLWGGMLTIAGQVESNGAFACLPM